MRRSLLLFILLVTGGASSGQEKPSPLRVSRPFDGASRQDPSLLLERIQVNQTVVTLSPDNSRPLVIGPGRHRFDFDFSYPDCEAPDLTQLRYRLEGKDVKWLTSTNGMALKCQVRDRNNEVISEVKFDANGKSEGWNHTLAESKFTSHSEPFFIPKEGRSLYLEMNSGSPDATGTFAIKELHITLPKTDFPILWSDGDFARGKDLHTPEGTPHRWSRIGSDPSIARLTRTSDQTTLTLIDQNKELKAAWASLRPFDANIFAGRTVVISWQETYNVVGGSVHRASYLNVPPGDYTFHAIGMTNDGTPATASLELAIRITPPFWERPWFLPLIATSCVALLAGGIILNARRRENRRLREQRFQNDLERDRARIARDMHDDLGTRMSVLSLNGAMALQDLDQEPENTRRLLTLMKSSSREMIVAMDDLVWAVDPAYDNLDHFASHLTRMAEEIFRESSIRYRLDIPAQVPPLPLGSDFRYQLALAVKEALHNVLRHAGQSEVTLSLKTEDERLLIRINDTGCGFKPDPKSPRHGLSNLQQRLEDIGGTCTITSTLGEGTTIDFICPLSEHTTPMNS
ncbi:MAG: ATP-binding protein [Roseibacillus sp.]